MDARSPIHTSEILEIDTPGNPPCTRFRLAQNGSPVVFQTDKDCSADTFARTFRFLQSDQLGGGVRYPALTIVRQFYLEPARPPFEQVKFHACVQRILETIGIALAVALPGNDILCGDYTAHSLGCVP